MALSSTVFTFEIDLADADRDVYEHLDLRVAKHPSESDEFLVARILAYCLEYTDGIEFSRGLCDADEPPIAVRDMTGEMQVWIDIGLPSAERLHRASKHTPRVVVYIHKDPAQWLRAIEGSRIHRAELLELRRLAGGLVGALAASLERRMSFAVSVSGGDVSLSLTDRTISGHVEPIALGDGLK